MGRQIVEGKGRLERVGLERDEKELDQTLAQGKNRSTFGLRFGGKHIAGWSSW